MVILFATAWLSRPCRFWSGRQGSCKVKDRQLSRYGLSTVDLRELGKVQKVCWTALQLATQMRCGDLMHFHIHIRASYLRLIVLHLLQVLTRPSMNTNHPGCQDPNLQNKKSSGSNLDLGAGCHLPCLAWEHLDCYGSTSIRTLQSDTNELHCITKTRASHVPRNRVGAPGFGFRICSEALG